MKEITEAKLSSYLEITKKALALAEKNKGKKDADIILDMAQRYFDDALHFKSKGDFVNAFAAVNYAHGWLDCGARLGYFTVKDSSIFAVDD